MELGSAVRVLLRRWLVVLIGLTLTLAACAYLYKTADPTYRSDGRMLLLLPANARGDDSVGSPYLYMPSGLNVLTKLAIVTPNSHSFRAEMEAQGYLPDYELGVDPTTPIIIVGVEGSDADTVVATRDRVIDAVRQELARVQEEEDVPENQMAHARVYDAEPTAASLGGDWTRAVLAAGAAGGLVTLLVAFGIDRLLTLRRRPQRWRDVSDANSDQAAGQEGFTPRHPSGEHVEPSAGLAAVGASVARQGTEGQ